MLTDTQLQQIMPRLSAAKLPLTLPHLNRAMQAYGVDTMPRTAAFIAQLWLNPTVIEAKPRDCGTETT